MTEDIPSTVDRSTNTTRTPGQEKSDEQKAEERERHQGFKVYDRRFWNMSDEELEAEAETDDRAPSYVEQLETQLKEKDEQLKQYIAAYKKEVVEGMQQAKERLARDAAQQIAAERAKLATPMLEVLEAIERSLQMAEQAGADPQATQEGLRRIHLLMTQKLKETGLQRIATLGQPFDPAVHEALGVVNVDDPKLHNMVTMEFSPGFSLDGRVIRPARVQVGKSG